ncbi:hypothetical protein XA68_11334 [Ophiocordyceps unilateralis]|uniref:Uncharacterized protein n=1 Tax=Ophiocordyceps unilateralis TaxID=268505 RepID=A0A2A9P259_OPHUN|nr:hypothetical protein XA68_11334 [Ophiocordyceps unilateralis]
MVFKSSGPEGVGLPGPCFHYWVKNCFENELEKGYCLPTLVVQIRCLVHVSRQCAQQLRVIWLKDQISIRRWEPDPDRDFQLRGCRHNDPFLGPDHPGDHWSTREREGGYDHVCFPTGALFLGPPGQPLLNFQQMMGVLFSAALQLGLLVDNVSEPLV